MLDVQVKKTSLIRTQDIDSWEEVDISALNARQKKRFQKHRSAIAAYFTTETPLEEIAKQHNISVNSLLLMASKCVIQHEDGMLWGYRALLPGANVIDHSPSSVVKEPIKIPTILSLPETPLPAFDDEELENQARGDLDGVRGVGVGMAELVPAMPTRQEVSQDGDIVGIVVAGASSATTIPIPAILSYAISSVVEEQEVHADSVAEIDREDHEEPPSLAAEVMTLPPSAALVIPEDDTVVSKCVRRQSSDKTGSHRRLAHKRHLHSAQVQTKQRQRLYKVISMVLVTIVLLGVLVPLGAGLAAYSIYNNVRGTAQDGVNHLLNVKTLLAVSKSDPMAALDAKKLQQAQDEFRLAQNDFVQLQQLTSRPDVLAAVEQFSPDYANKLLMARHLVRVALDVSQMGQEVSSVALIGANVIHSSPLASGSAKPLLSVADVAAVDGALIHALYYIDDIRTQMSQVRLKDLPISDKQKTQLVGVLEQLPKVQELLTQGQSMIGLVSWLLGVGQQRRFLVQTLDRAELRPSGGFTGQYGILQIQDGRMAPFSLRDVALLDYAGNGVELGRPAPPQYSWMSFGNWGLRDSNLSGDYPTTAKMSMQVFQEEGGGPVDGDISFTPTFIGHILDVTGPIRVAEYNETITSKNLEERLHYYQQDYSAIAVEHQKSNDNSHAARKAFTSLVGKILLDRVRHLPTTQLLNIIKGAIKDIQARDLEIYFANPLAEQWLVDHGYSGGTDSFTKQDGFMVVQSNISISKASQYVYTTEHDDVALDAQGGATHTLTITLDYRQTGPVYGFDTYADYIRVYVPQTAQFLSGDGFDTGQALCNPMPPPPPGKGSTGGTGGGTVPGGPATGCDQYKTFFPSSARYCPSGNYDMEDRGFRQPWVVDSLGAPTNLNSDLPGHSMWGGLTETPKNCVSYITLSWYVPHVVKNVAGQPPYVLLVQKQGGYVPSVELKIDPTSVSIKGLKPFSFTGNLPADKLFAFPARK